MWTDKPELFVAEGFGWCRTFRISKYVVLILTKFLYERKTETLNCTIMKSSNTLKYKIVKKVLNYMLREVLFESLTSV